jgi:hypothetical protein
MVSATQLLAGLGLGLLTLAEGRACESKPTVTIKNGTYYGVHNSEFNQDFFLGMPFAKVSQPVGSVCDRRSPCDRVP